MNPVEQKILACATALNPEPHHHQTLRDLMSTGVDWEHLIESAIHEGLAGLLYKNLKRSGILENLGPEQNERLQSFYYQTLSFNLQLINELKEVLHLLNEKEIRVVLLQGVDLLQQVYEDIGLRPMLDIDLWLLPEDYDSLTGILVSRGYQQDALYPNTYRKGSTTFDLHTHFLWTDRIQACQWLLKRGEDHIFDDTRIIDLEGEEALCLSPYDQVLYLSLHALKHYANKLIWLVDIKNLVMEWNGSQWKTLLRHAEELGQERTLGYILFLLHHLLDYRPPEVVRQRIERRGPNLFEKRILRERLKRDTLPVWAPVLLFSSGKGLRKGFSFIFESIFPRPEILRQIFVDSANFGVMRLYWMRVLSLLGRIRFSTKGS